MNYEENTNKTALMQTATPKPVRKIPAQRLIQLITL